MALNVICPHCGSAQAVAAQGDDLEAPVACAHCASDFFPSQVTQPPAPKAERTVRSLNVFCPRCGASRSVLADPNCEVEPPISCFACANPFFASEATQPPVPGRVRVLGPDGPRRVRVLKPIETVCPHCGTEGEVDAPVGGSEPTTTVQCFACAKSFTIPEVTRRREPRRRNRRPRRPLTYYELRERAAGRTRAPAVALSIIAAIQLCSHVAMTFVFLWLAFVIDPPPNAEQQFMSLIFCGLALLFVAKDVVVLAGMRALERRRGYSRAMAGAVCALIPDIGWVFALGFGIWALVMLNNREVRVAFDAVPSPESEADANAEADRRADVRSAITFPAVMLLFSWIVVTCFTIGLVIATVAQFRNVKPGAGDERYWLAAYSVVAVLATAVGLVGACAALQVRWRGLAIASALLLAVCFGVSIVGLGVGIWCLTVFYRADVIEAFQGTTRTGRSVRYQESIRSPG